MTLNPKALEAALQRIVALNPDLDSDQGWNEWGESDCFKLAQDVARAALSAAPHAEAELIEPTEAADWIEWHGGELGRIEGLLEELLSDLARWDRMQYGGNESSREGANKVKEAVTARVSSILAALRTASPTAAA